MTADAAAPRPGRNAVRSDTLDRYLWDLAARVPAPGGGVTAGLHLAQAAALLGMAARYSDGDRRAAHAATVESVRNRADELRVVGMGLAEDDARAATAAACAPSRRAGPSPAAPAAAVERARVEAGRVPARVVGVAGQLLDLAELLRPVADPDVLTAVGAAAEAARAAASTARLAVEAGLPVITDPLARLELCEAVDEVDDLLRRADSITAAVREQVRR